MQLVIEQASFLKLIREVLPALNPRGIVMLPCYSSIRLEAVAGELRAFATDGTMALGSTTAAEVTQPGAVGVVGKSIEELIKQLQGTVRLSVASRLCIESGRSRLQLNTIHADSFPDLLSVQTTYDMAGDFFTSMDEVAFAASKDPDKKTMQGVLLSKNGFFVAVDGRRMAISPYPSPLPKDVVIPADTVARLRKAFTLPSVGIALEGSALYFVSNHLRGTVRLLDGGFPDWQRVIPQHPTTTVGFNLKEFIRGLKLVGPMSPSVHLKITDQQLELVSSSPEHGEASFYMECQTKGPAVAPLLDPELLEAAVSRLEGECGTFELKAAQHPILLYANQHRHIIMPKRL